MNAEKYDESRVEEIPGKQQFPRQSRPQPTSTVSEQSSW